jgi:hypothetical protein
MLGGWFEKAPPLSAAQRRALAWERLAGYGYYMVIAGLVIAVFCGYMTYKTAGLDDRWQTGAVIGLFMTGIGGFWAVYCQYIIYGCAAVIVGMTAYLFYKSHKGTTTKKVLDDTKNNLEKTKTALVETVQSFEQVKGKPWDGVAKKVVNEIQSPATKEQVATIRTAK